MSDIEVYTDNEKGNTDSRTGALPVLFDRTCFTCEALCGKAIHRPIEWRRATSPHNTNPLSIHHVEGDWLTRCFSEKEGEA